MIAGKIFRRNTIVQHPEPYAVILTFHIALAGMLGELLLRNLKLCTLFRLKCKGLQKSLDYYAK